MRVTRVEYVGIVNLSTVHPIPLIKKRHMKFRIFSVIASVVIVVGSVFPTMLHAGQKKSSPKSAATPVAQDPADNPRVQKILSDLRPHFPHLTPSEIATTSEHDLRALYYKSYRAEQVTMMEAKEKARALPSEMFRFSGCKK